MTRSQRLDFGRPINFNPGPGSYLFDKQSKAKNNLDTFLSVQNAELKRKGFDKNKMRMTNDESGFNNQ